MRSRPVTLMRGCRGDRVGAGGVELFVRGTCSVSSVSSGRRQCSAGVLGVRPAAPAMRSLYCAVRCAGVCSSSGSNCEPVGVESGFAPLTSETSTSCGVSCSAGVRVSISGRGAHQPGEAARRLGAGRAAGRRASCRGRIPAHVGPIRRFGLRPSGYGPESDQYEAGGPAEYRGAGR